MHVISTKLLHVDLATHVQTTTFLRYFNKIKIYDKVLRALQHIPKFKKAQAKGFTQKPHVKSKNQFLTSHLTKEANPTVTALERSVGSMNQLGA